MAYRPDEITKTFEQTLTEIQQTAQTVLPGITFLPATPTANLTDVGAIVVMYMRQAVLANVSALSPEGATTTGVRYIGQNVGLPQKQATNTQVNLVFTGPSGTIIPAGTLVSNTTNSIIVSTLTDSVIPTSGSLTTTAESPATGAITIPANSLTVVPSVANVTVNNPQPGVLGQNTESDSAYLIRIQQAMRTNRLGAIELVQTLVNNIPGVVTRLTAITNTTSTQQTVQVSLNYSAVTNPTIVPAGTTITFGGDSWELVQSSSSEGPSSTVIVIAIGPSTNTPITAGATGTLPVAFSEVTAEAESNSTISACTTPQALVFGGDSYDVGLALFTAGIQEWAANPSQFNAQTTSQLTFTYSVPPANITEVASILTIPAGAAITNGVVTGTLTQTLTLQINGPSVTGQVIFSGNPTIAADSLYVINNSLFTIPTYSGGPALTPNISSALGPNTAGVASNPAITVPIIFNNRTYDVQYLLPYLINLEITVSYSVSTKTSQQVFQNVTQSAIINYFNGLPSGPTININSLESLIREQLAQNGILVNEIFTLEFSLTADGNILTVNSLPTFSTGTILPSNTTYGFDGYFSPTESNITFQNVG